MIKVTETRYIEETVESILQIIRQETSDSGDMFLRDIMKRGDNFIVTCPFHADHREKKPACTVFGIKHNSFEEGDYHCFVCNAHGPLSRLVAGCFEKDEEYGRTWLIEQFGNTYVEHDLFLPPIDLNRNAKTGTEYLDESILNTFQDYHPYMDSRKISPEVRDRYKIKYDHNTKSLVFPVWDESDKLYMLTRRSVVDRTFIIDAAKEKPVYLMNFVNKKDIPYVIVVESQINALTCLSYGLSSVATFGVGITPKQFEIFNKSGVTHYILAFDGDEAGSRAVKRFMKNIRKDVFVDVINMPPGKDVNDLTKDEFLVLLKKENLDYERLKNIYESRINTG